MKDFFNSEANPVGNSFIRVVQDEGGNWYLKSVVFTEIFNAIPIVGSYAFSLDILGAGGAVSSGVFVRGLDTAPAFYEADSYPDASTTRSGLMLYPRADKLGVNVKTYDPNRTADNAFLKNNTVMFDLPAGVTYPYTLKVTDTSEEIAVYVNNTLICRITLSDPGKTYEKHDSDETCYGSAKLYAADGRELASYTDTLLDCDGALFGWATRASDISVDNVRVWIGKAQQTAQAIGKIPTTVTAANLNKATELATAARALYDSLSDAEKELIVNYDKLTDTETAIKAAITTANTFFMIKLSFCLFIKNRLPVAAGLSYEIGCVAQNRRTSRHTKMDTAKRTVSIMPLIRAKEEAAAAQQLL
jgi:hypothetical protein